MKIGVVKEIKDRENRVALTPQGVEELVKRGHSVMVGAGAGIGSGFDDEAYRRAGAMLVSAADAWGADLVVKVKEPLESEYQHLRDQIVFTYFHLSGVAKALTETLLDRRTTAIAYETVEDADGRLPLLAPMSGVAGNMALTMGNHYLARPNGGKGTLLGRVGAHRYGKVMVIGDGTVGRHAARAAVGMGANVHLFGRNLAREADLKEAVSEDINFVLSNAANIALHVRDTDLLVGAVLRRGGRAPELVTEAMVQSMQPGSVVVDVSIDQGGCVATARPTSHSAPVYTEHGVIHYCVPNMPGAYPRTSTIALTDATLPYVVALAEKGLEALREDEHFARGVNTHHGHICYRPVAEDLGLMHRYEDFSKLAG
jgi:alanine dehydrogenase